MKLGIQEGCTDRTDIAERLRPRNLDGKKLESTAKDGFDPGTDDDKNKIEDLVQTTNEVGEGGSRRQSRAR